MKDSAASVFTPEWAASVFPPERTNAFFDALFGDAEEGAYTIAFRFAQARGPVLEFAFDLHQRNGKCLACNLTYGLPQVFARHPIINIKALVEEIAKQLGKKTTELTYELRPTNEISSALHSIPFIVTCG